MLDEHEDRELRTEWGGLWLAGVVLALCGAPSLIRLCRRAIRSLRGRG